MGAPSQLGFNMDQTFFGFKPSDNIKIHKQLFNLLWAGEGRWSFDDIYNLPLHLRNMWINQIKKIREEEQKQIEQLRSKSTSKKMSFPKRRIKT